MPEIRRQTGDGKTNIDLYEGDERLAWLTVFVLPMRIGDCVVRCGGRAAMAALLHRLAERAARPPLCL